MILELKIISWLEEASIQLNTKDLWKESKITKILFSEVAENNYQV